MINKDTYKKNLAALANLKTKKSKIEGNIETRTNQIEKIKEEIEAIKLQIKTDYKIEPKNLKSVIDTKKSTFNDLIEQVTEKIEELEQEDE